MFRHGARGPGSSLYNLNKWKLYGELTEVGIRQEYLLGSQFRKRYILGKKLLPETFDYSSIMVESTAKNRTIMSAYSFLSGLYPPLTGP